jgi:transposase-like protein
MPSGPERESANPTRCPYCASPSIVVAGKVTAASYWRCEDCGQIWNPGRLRETWAHGRR